MVRFLVEFVLYSALLLAATVPVTIVANQRNMTSRPRKWRIGAIGFALVVAVLGWSSRDLINQCIEARNEACFDMGSAGMKVLFLGGFIGWSLLSAYLLYND